MNRIIDFIWKVSRIVHLTSTYPRNIFLFTTCRIVLNVFVLATRENQAMLVEVIYQWCDWPWYQRSCVIQNVVNPITQATPILWSSSVTTTCTTAADAATTTTTTTTTTADAATTTTTTTTDDATTTTTTTTAAVDDDDDICCCCCYYYYNHHVAVTTTTTTSYSFICLWDSRNSSQQERNVAPW